MRTGIVELALAFLVGTATSVLAQQTTGTITGRVTDPQGLVVPGAAVTVTGAQGSNVVASDTNGRFTAPFLTPGTYTVRAELQGFRPHELKTVEVRLGQTVDVSLALTVESLTDTVTVAQTVPVVDTTSTTTGVNLDAETLNRVPVGRRFSDTLYISPGISSSGAAGAANPSVSGASGLENLYVVDGVNITNQGFGALGSYSIVFGSLGNGTPYDFIKEIDVKTGGFDAEFGQTTGGVINVITKSGSNTLRGSVFGYTRPDAFEAAFTQVQTPNGTVNTTGARTADAGIEIGGRAVRNRVFWFAAVNPQGSGRTFMAPDGFPLRVLGTVDRDRTIVSYAGKGTWQLANQHRIDASFFGDPARGNNGPQRIGALLRSTTSAFSQIDRFGGHNQIVKYDGALSPGWLLEASWGRAANEIREIPSVNDWAVTDTTVTPFVRTGGIGFYEAGNSGRTFQYQVKSTNLFRGWGEHAIRSGWQYEDVAFDQINQYTGATFLLYDGTRTATGATVQILPDPSFGRIYRVTQAGLNPARNTNQQYTALFVQDTWKIGSHLTINPGLRYEQQTLHGTEVDDFTLDNNWGPRIGATFSLTADNKGKIYGHYGRYFARLPNDLAARALSADQLINADYFDEGLTKPIPEGVLAGPEGKQTTTHFSILGATADVIDPEAKSTAFTEYVTGIEYEAVAGLNLGARYVYRNLDRLLEDVTMFPLVAGDLGIPGADGIEYLLTNPGPNTPVAGGLDASFEAPVHTYHAIELTADKRFRNSWSLHTSYRWSRLRGTVEGFFRDDNGQSDPGITSLYDFPTNDPSYSGIGVQRFGYRGDIRYLGRLGAGPLPLDRPHQVKVYGSYAFPFGLNIGTGIDVSSGKPLTPLAANPSYSAPGEIPEGPRGSGFETVDGFRTRSPFLAEVNLHVDYALGFGGGPRLTLIGDLFNLFNQKTVLDYDNFSESTFASPNPNFGQPRSLPDGPAIQAPFGVRLGVRYSF
jgi:outer membrane receptor protein involved in Fe transport